MIESAVGALTWVLNLKGGERVLIVTDQKSRYIGVAFRDAVRLLGAISDLYLLPEDHRPLTEIPDDLKALFKNRNVFVNAFSGLPDETPFRIKLIKAEIATGARVGHAPGITEDMMTEGPMAIDYKEVKANAMRLIEAFRDADRVHVTAPGGTDITFCIRNRDFETDVEIPPGHMGNLPPGEIWCAPVEDRADGVIICDGSIGDLGQVPSPVRIDVSRGKITSITCDDAVFAQRIKDLTTIDEMASVIGEFGIGVNPKARITGNLLEDEKAGRTAHIAFGNNENMPGGKNRSKTHRDFLFHMPTIDVTYIDGSHRIAMRDGEVQI